MKKMMLLSAALLLQVLGVSAQAENLIRVKAPITKSLGAWEAIEGISTAWANVGGISGCSNWAPAASTIGAGIAFNQTATDCQQGQERTTQAREENSITHQVRNVGEPEVSSQTVLVSSTRSATGTATATFIDFTDSASSAQLPIATSSNYSRGASGYTSLNHGNVTTGYVTFSPISLQQGTVLTFTYRVSSEGCCDRLQISVGTAQVLQIAGEQSGSISYTIPSTASYAIDVRYTKDVSISTGSDVGIVSSLNIKRP